MHLFAWGGALLFVASLVYFFFHYLVTFGRIVEGGAVMAPVIWNTALFTLFALHHSVFARARVRAWVARTWPPALERSLYVWVASLLFVALCAWWRPVPGVAWNVDGVALRLLRLVQATGLGLSLASAGILDVRELAGLRQGGAGRAGGMEFKTRGPYGLVRHPIYAGWFLFVFAASPMTMTRLVFAVVSCAYLLVAIPLEERTLKRTSGGAYDRYMARVRWKLVPGVF